MKNLYISNGQFTEHVIVEVLTPTTFEHPTLGLIDPEQINNDFLGDDAPELDIEKLRDEAIKEAYIPGFNDYKVNTKGEITHLGVKLKPRDNGKGYKSVSLPDGRNHYIHRIVARAFISDNIDEMHVNHKDGNSSNNNIDNIELLTPEEHYGFHKKLVLYPFEILDNTTGEIITIKSPKDALKYASKSSYITQLANRKRKRHKQYTLYTGD